MADAEYSILIADDDIAIIQLVVHYLGELSDKFKDSIQIHQAKTATGALKILSEHRIDVVLLDYHFKGGMSGDDVIDRIEDPFDNMFIILMSKHEPETLEPIIIKRHRHLSSRFKFLTGVREILNLCQQMRFFTEYRV